MEDSIDLSKEYLNKIAEINDFIFDYIKNDNNTQYDFQNLISFIEKETQENKEDLKMILYFLSKVSKNHRQTGKLFDNITDIILYLCNFFTSDEIIPIFKSNKRIMLLLITKEIISPKKYYTNYLIENREDIGYILYFYPEIKTFLNDNSFEEKYKEILNCEDFEDKRQIGENDSYICKLIRNDLIDEFIPYVNRKIYPLSSQIESSIFETNSFLIKKKPTLIEYASFYGSIQIFNYLRFNNVKLTSSLWLYAIHSNNPELIHLLDSLGVDRNEENFLNFIKESIKCHHNSMANYFINNEISICDSDLIVNSLKYYNLNFLPANYFDDFKLMIGQLIRCDYIKIVRNFVNNKIIDYTTELVFKSFLLKKFH